MESNWAKLWASFTYAHIVKRHRLKEAQNGPPKKSKIDFLDENDYSIVKNV